MKSGEGPTEKQEILWEKLRRVGKRGGHTTPVASFWGRNELGDTADFLTGGGGGDEVQDGGNLIEGAAFRIVSSRKLAAALWELHHYKLPFDNMRHGVSVPPPRLRRLNHHHSHRDPPPSSPDPPENSSNLRRRVAESIMQHHRSIEKSTHAIRTVSPPSYGSSMEIAPYNPAFTPPSSIELKGRSSESSYCLRTSSELVKVLNRIWSLEERHVYNMSLIKALKKELDRARSRTKDLVREQQVDRHEMDELMKQITGEKLARKNKEQDRINAAVQSMRDELENERKLRQHSESLHNKLAQELYEAKTALAGICTELERERKSRGLLEELCDQFAWGVTDYEKELHALRQKSDEDWDDRADHDHLIRMSELWLHERIQVKLQPRLSVGEKKSAMDKLSSEIEAFLQRKRNSKVNITGNQVAPRNPICQRSSVDSIPLNVGASAPRVVDDEDDPVGSGSKCFELEKTSKSNSKSQIKKLQKNHREETVKRKQLKKKHESSDRTREPSPSSLQVKFEEHMAQAMSYGVRSNQAEDYEQITTGQGDPGETSISQKTEEFEAAKEDISEQKHESEGISGMDSNYAIENLIRNHYLFSESGNMQPIIDYGVLSSIWRSYPSPVREWTEKLPPQDLNISETYLELPDMKEDNSKAKLSEARKRSQRSRSS